MQIRRLPRLEELLAKAGARRTLLPFFLIVTAAVIAVIVLALDGVIKHEVQAQALAEGERSAVTFADFMFESDEFRGGRPTKEGLDDLDDLISTSQTLSGARVLSPTGYVYYASDAAQLRATRVDTSDFGPVLTGRPTSEITSFAAEQSSGEGSDGKKELVEVDVPLGSQAGRQPLAILALYSPYTPVAAQISRTTRKMNLIVGGAGLALYLLLIPSLNRVSRGLARSIDPAKALIQRRLDRALTAGELVLHYQPKIDLGSDRVIGAEALVRWVDPKRGLIPPDDFIPAAEDGPQIGALTDYVFDRACAQRAEWLRKGLDLPIAVNLSTRNLLDEDLPVKLRRALELHHVGARDFTLEITESAVMEDLRGSLLVVDELSAMGFGVSIDDFGTGQSSLIRLEQLPITELKIDRGFIIGLASSGRAAIVRAIIGIGHDLDLEVVAEGVEDLATLDLLRDEGCDQAQGYFVSRPVAPGALEAWLENRRSAARAIAPATRTAAT